MLEFIERGFLIFIVVRVYCFFLRINMFFVDYIVSIKEEVNVIYIELLILDSYEE